MPHRPSAPPSAPAKYLLRIESSGSVQFGPEGQYSIPALNISGNIDSDGTALLVATATANWTPFGGITIPTLEGTLAFDESDLVEASVSNAHRPVAFGFADIGLPDVFEIAELVLKAGVYAREDDGNAVASPSPPRGAAASPPASPPPSRYLLAIQSSGTVQIGPPNTQYSMPALDISGSVDSDGTAQLSVATENEWTPLGEPIIVVPALSGSLVFDSKGLRSATGLPAPYPPSSGAPVLDRLPAPSPLSNEPYPPPRSFHLNVWRIRLCARLYRAPLLPPVWSVGAPKSRLCLLGSGGSGQPSSSPRRRATRVCLCSHRGWRSVSERSKTLAPLSRANCNVCIRCNVPLLPSSHAGRAHPGMSDKTWARPQML